MRSVHGEQKGGGVYIESRKGRSLERGRSVESSKARSVHTEQKVQG